MSYFCDFINNNYDTTALLDISQLTSRSLSSADYRYRNRMAFRNGDIIFARRSDGYYWPGRVTLISNMENNRDDEFFNNTNTNYNQSQTQQQPKNCFYFVAFYGKKIDNNYETGWTNDALPYLQYRNYMIANSLVHHSMKTQFLNAVDEADYAFNQQFPIVSSIQEQIVNNTIDSTSSSTIIDYFTPIFPAEEKDNTMDFQLLTTQANNNNNRQSDDHNFQPVVCDRNGQHLNSSDLTAIQVHNQQSSSIDNNFSPLYSISSSLLFTKTQQSNFTPMSDIQQQLGTNPLLKTGNFFLHENNPPSTKETDHMNTNNWTFENLSSSSIQTPENQPIYSPIRCETTSSIVTPQIASNNSNSNVLGFLQTLSSNQQPILNETLSKAAMVTIVTTELYSHSIFIKYIYDCLAPYCYRNIFCLDNEMMNRSSCNYPSYSTNIYLVCIDKFDTSFLKENLNKLLMNSTTVKQYYIILNSPNRDLITHFYTTISNKSTILLTQLHMKIENHLESNTNGLNDESVRSPILLCSGDRQTFDILRSLLKQICSKLKFIENSDYKTDDQLNSPYVTSSILNSTTILNQLCLNNTKQFLYKTFSNEFIQKTQPLLTELFPLKQNSTNTTNVLDQIINNNTNDKTKQKTFMSDMLNTIKPPPICEYYVKNILEEIKNSDLKDKDKRSLTIDNYPQTYHS